MFVYDILLRLYAFAIRIAALWIPKAKQWVDGREDLFERLRSAIPVGERLIWVHVASLGEFEQGRPIIERIKAERSEYKILLTFFSPSGYEIRKNYAGADYIFYLPIDTASNARRFLDITNPEIAIFVKYEFWINLLWGLRRRGAKVYIISSIFRRNSIFFQWYGSRWRAVLRAFDVIFVQDSGSRELLSELKLDNVVVAGDTRFDRVAQIANSRVNIPVVERFKAGGKLMVVGSSWPADERIIIPLIKEYAECKFLIASHEIDHDRISALIASLSGLSVVRFSEVGADDDCSAAQVMILDTMGMLSSVYAYADLAYIGGGFGVGIHNTLEAATFALPIAFGTNYQKFKEACDMVELGACCSVDNLEELREWFAPLYSDDLLRAKVSALSKDYANSKFGATDTIFTAIFE